MSKGGAGKVYFVLYLAVILELLIIIVERDEAEEGLMKKQKESMRIVESILTQLQSGAGTEGINTRPQDAIILSEKFPAEQQKYFKKFRTYYIEVGVTDVSSALNMDGMEEPEKKERVETLKKLANVQELQYEVYYHPSTEVDVPPSPPQSEFKRVELNPVAGTKLANDANAISSETWEMQATRRLDLNASAMKDYAMPVYTESQIKTGEINTFAPADSVRTNRVFSYSEDKTERLKIANGSKTTKRAFVVNFQPPSKPGWYKLRFSSRTNRIMGISAEQNIATLKDDAKVNIGTVQLKVKDLRSVQRQLAEQLSGTGVPSAERFAAGDITVENFDKDLNTAKETILQSKDENKSEKASRVDLYRYIAKLLSPGKYTSFDQNRGSIEIDISVQQPTIEQEEPVLTWEHNREFYTVDKASKIILYLNSNLYDKATPSITFNNATYTPKKDPKNSTIKTGRWYVELPTPTLKDPKNTPESFEVVANLNNASGQAKDILNLTVFPTRLAVISGTEDDGTSYSTDLNDDFEKTFNLEMGDNLTFNAVPFTNSKILNQFYTYIKYEGFEKEIPKYSLSNADGIQIPRGISNIFIKVYWKNPQDTNEKRNIFPSEDGKEFADISVSTPRPKIILQETPQIQDLRNPIISVTAKIENSKHPNAIITGVSFKIDDKKSKIAEYRVIPLKPENFSVSDKNLYTQKFTLDGKLPLKKNFAGSFKIKISAKLKLEGSESDATNKSFTVPISVKTK